jgi:hypothetical protein
MPREPRQADFRRRENLDLVPERTELSCDLTGGEPGPFREQDAHGASLALIVFKADMSGPSKIIHILIAVMLVYGFYKIKYPTYTYRLPTLVTVTHPTDARTARIVNVDELGSTFGVHLRSISVEMTKDAVTPMDIERHLPFLVNERDQRVETRYPGVFSPFYSSFVR